LKVDSPDRVSYTITAHRVREEVGRRTREALAAVATYNRGGCPKCGDSEALAFLAKLKRIVGEDPNVAGKLK
jgi:hypothetical protein